MKISKTILFITILLVITLKVNSQISTFSFTHSSSRDEVIHDAIEDENGNFIMVGYSKAPFNNVADSSLGLIFKINKYGDLLDSTKFNFEDKSCSILDIKKLKNDTFLLNGITYSHTSIYDAKYSSSLMLGKLNNNLSMYDTSLFKLNDNMGFYHSEINIENDSVIYQTGSLYNGYSNVPLNMFINSYNLNLNRIDSVLFNQPSHGVFIKEINNNSIMITGRGFSSFFPRYIFVDSNFQFVNEIPISLNDGHSPFGMKWDSDTSFYLCSYWINSVEGQDVGIIYQKSINNFNDYLFNSWGSQDTLCLPSKLNGLDFKTKDSIYIAGTKGYIQYPYSDYSNWLFVIQTDSLLNIRWERFYGGDAFYAANAVIATKDGGCLIIGSSYDYLNSQTKKRNSIAIKVNNEGLLTSIDQIPTNNFHEAIIYPNPGTTNLNVRLAVQHKTADFHLYNLNGESIIEKKLNSKTTSINTSSLESGTYIYKILNNKGLYESGKWVKN